MDDVRHGQPLLPPPPLPPPLLDAPQFVVREELRGVPVTSVDGRGRKTLIHATFQRVAHDHEDELIEIHMSNETDPVSSLLILKLRQEKRSRDEAHLARLQQRFPMLPRTFQDVSHLFFRQLQMVKRGEEGRCLTLIRLKTVCHLWFQWRREDIFEVPFFPASQKKAREVAKMKSRTINIREKGFEAKCCEKDRRIQELEERLADADREMERLRMLVGDLQDQLRRGDGLVGHLQARLDAFQERPHGVPVGIQVNLPREVLMDVPLGPSQEASMDRPLLLSDSVGSPEEAESVYFDARDHIPVGPLDDSGEAWVSALDLPGGVQGPSVDLLVEHQREAGSAGVGPGERQPSGDVPPACSARVDVPTTTGRSSTAEGTSDGAESRHGTIGKRRRCDDEEEEEDSAIAGNEGQGPRPRKRCRRRT